MSECGKFIDKLSTETVEDFLGSRPSPGIYIPAYQRRFSWGENEFTRFFEDIAYELRSEQDSYCTLLGNIVCFNDAYHDYIEDGDPDEQPKPLYNVVDGQQRLSFIVLLAVSLHNYIILGSAACQNNSFLMKLASNLKGDLENVFSLWLDGRKNPKIARALEDAWGFAGREKYKSPIARYIGQYIEKCAALEKPFEYSYSAEGVKKNKDRHEKFGANTEKLRDLVNNFCSQEGISEAMQIPPVEALLNNKPLMMDLFKSDFGARNFDDKEKPMLRAMILGNYICKCVCLIVLRIRGQYDKSFTVFSSINTAGKLLNAFETFVPEVVRFETACQGYQGSKSCDYMTEIAQDLEKMAGNEEAADRFVSETIISFALSYSGTALSGKLYYQQKYLKEEFSKINSEEGKRKFIEFFYYVHQSRKLFTSKRMGVKHIIGNHTFTEEAEEKLKQTVFCLKFLERAGFKLSVAIFAKYLYNMHLQDFDEEAVKLFCSSVMKAAAFCALWRSASQSSTSGIDAEIRNLPVMGGDKILESDNFIFGEKELAQHFRNSLINGKLKVKNYDKWTQLAHHTEMTACKEVVRFLLLVGSHNRGLDSNLSIIEWRDSNAHKTIDEKTFESGGYATIEHVIPVQEQEEQKSGLDAPTKNQLWNLTLLPRSVNSAAGNNRWGIKQKQYAVFSSTTKEEYKEKLKELEKEPGGKSNLFKKGEVKYAFSLKTNLLSKINRNKYTRKEGVKITNKVLEITWGTIAKEWLKWPG